MYNQSVYPNLNPTMPRPTPRLRRFIALLPFAFYIALGLYYLGGYRHQCNPDGTSYVAAAEKYLAGDFHHAVSGHWAPMISWLLTVPLALGVEKGLAFKLIILLTGLLALGGLGKLLDRFAPDFWVNKLVMFAAAALLVRFGYRYNTPDVLAAALLVWYLVVLWHPHYLRHAKWAFFAGALGALGYMTKHYALAFTFVHLPLMHALYLLGAKPDERRLVWGQLARSMMIFLLLCLPWALVISAKYGYFTFTTAGTYNDWLMAPNGNGHPIEWAEMLAPPVGDSLAYGAWDDPTSIQTEGWGPRPFSLSDRWALIRSNFRNTFLDMDEQPHRQTILYASLLLLPCLWLYRRQGWRSPVLWFALFWLLYPMGYWPLWIEPRYIWGMYLLAGLPVAWLFGAAVNPANLSGSANGAAFQKSWARLRLTFVARLLAAGLAAFVLSRCLVDLAKSLRDTEKHYAYFHGSLEHFRIDGRRFAGESHPSLWNALAYFNRGVCCGVVKPETDCDRTLELLEKNDVQLFFTTDTCAYPGFVRRPETWSGFFIHEK